MSTAIPRNAARFSLPEAAALTGGRVVLRDATREVATGVLTDSRQSLAGAAFVALSGANFDGHSYVAAAAEQGVHWVVVERELPVPVNQLVVPSCRRALGQLSGEHRRRWGGKLIAVAGSAGKTSTKSAVGATLSELLPGQVHVTPGNLNNDVGVPMVLLGLGPEHRVCVLEIGTNHTGEVPYLVEVARPDVAILTLIDLEHTAGLGDLDAIEREEAAVFAESVQLAVGNVDDERVNRRLRAVPTNQIGYGFSTSAEYRVASFAAMGLAGLQLEVLRADGSTLAFTSPGVGRPGAYSSLAALVVAEAVLGRKLGASELQAGLHRDDARPPGRLRLVEVTRGLLVIDDTYNANPVSMRAAIDTARELAAQRGAALHLALGEMRELGEFSRDEHLALGAHAALAAPHSVVAVAGDARLLLEKCDARFAENSAAALELLLPRLTGNDVVLVKGSRGVRTEVIVEGLVKKGSAS